MYWNVSVSSVFHLFVDSYGYYGFFLSLNYFMNQKKSVKLWIKQIRFICRLYFWHFKFHFCGILNLLLILFFKRRMKMSLLQHFVRVWQLWTSEVTDFIKQKLKTALDTLSLLSVEIKVLVKANYSELIWINNALTVLLFFKKK